MKVSNEAWHTLRCADEETAAMLCAQQIARELRATIDSKANATLFVSGGKSPAKVFDHLCQIPLPWSSVAVFLVDERLAWQQPQDQNQTLIQDRLLQSCAKEATFFPLLHDENESENLAICNQQAQFPIRPDVVLLGMGLDGHTASLFPCAPEYDHAMTAGSHYVVLHPVTAPYARISMSFHWLTEAHKLILYIPGENKRIAFEGFVKRGNGVSPLQPLFNAVAQHITVIETEGGQHDA